MNILNIALCLIIREGNILLIRRNKPPYQGWQGLPGGKIHFGETPQDAAIREAQEETGLQFDGCRVLGCATETIGNSETTTAHFTMFPALLTGAAGTLAPGAEGDLLWHPLTALPPDLIPTDRDLIKRFYPHPCPGVPHYNVMEDTHGYHLKRIDHTPACD